MAFEKLRHEAFLQATNGPHEGTQKTAWIEDMKNRSPTFMFWDMICRYEKLIFIMVRAHREKNFPLYIAVLEKLAPLFFALDHVNYARWVPVHIRDMKALPLSVKQEFTTNHNWVLSRTGRRFSAIPIDQAHEQLNKVVKGTGGIIGLTENPTALRYISILGGQVFDKFF